MANWRKPIIYLLLQLSGSNILRDLKEIRRIEKLALPEIEKIQREKLKKLLLHSYHNVPYYKNVLSRAGVVENGSINLARFNQIPVLTKDIIRSEAENLYSRDYKRRKPYKNTSGGSMGEPICIIQDKQYSDWNIAVKIYYKLIAGQDIGNKEFRIWGSERDALEGKEKFTIRLRNWLYNRI